jgi:hypothetical protein
MLDDFVKTELLSVGGGGMTSRNSR